MLENIMDPYLPISLALSNFVDWGSTHCSWKINKGIVNYKYDPIKKCHRIYIKSRYKWRLLACNIWIWVFVVITCKYSSIPCFYNYFSLSTNDFCISVNLTLLYFSIQRWTKDTISISFLPFVHYLFNFWIENLKSYCFVDIFRRVCRMLTD